MLEPPSADAVVLTIAIPPYAGVSGGTTISIRIGDSPAESKCCIGIGVNEVAFPVFSRVDKVRNVTIKIHSSSHFVPAKLRLNGDRRTLSVLLRRVVFQDTISGQRYMNGDALNAVAGVTRILDISAALAGSALTLFLGLKKRRFLWVAILVTAPFTFALGVSGTTVMLPKAVLLSGLVCLVLRPPRFRERSPHFWWVVLALACFVIEMLVADSKAHYLWPAIRETLKQIQYALTFGVAYAAYRRDPDENLVRVAVAALAVMVSILALGQGIFGANEFSFIFGRDIPRIAGPLEGPNQLGAFLGIVVAVMASFINLRRPRILELLAMLLSVAALLLTLSRGGLLGLVITLALVGVLRWKPQYGKAVIASLVLAWVAAFAATLHAAFASQSFGSRLLGAANAYNGGLGTRTELWKAASMLWRRSPWLGVGPGNYELLVGTFFAGVKTHANNYYLQILAEQGLVGLAAYLAIVTSSVSALARPPWKPLTVAAVAAVSALAFHQLVDGLLIYPKIGVFFWAIIGIALADSAAGPAVNRGPNSLSAR